MEGLYWQGGRHRPEHSGMKEQGVHACSLHMYTSSKVCCMCSACYTQCLDTC